MAHYRIFLAATVAFAALSSHAQAQQASKPADAQADPDAAIGADDDVIGEEISVVGQRQRGAVPGDIEPEVQFNAADIRSFGVGSVSELLTELAAQTASARGRDGGRPVMLLNGRRISSFAEIRDLPTEAIERVDILPEEAALRLGYRADQRVVNMVLRRRFRAITGEVQGGGATAGDRYTAAADATLLRISRDRRFNVNLHYDGATPVYEDDRDLLTSPPTRPYSILGNITPGPALSLIDPALPLIVAGVPDGVAGRPPLTSFGAPNSSDIGAFRTLAAAKRTLSANATYSRTILGNIAASLNGSFESSATDSSLGLGSASLVVPAGSPFSPFANPVTLNRYFVEAGPRLRQVDASTAHVGVALNGDIADWRWAFTGNYDRSLTQTFTDTNVDTSGLASRIAAGDPALNPFARYDRALIGDYARDFARSLTSTASAEVTASGPILTLPGGKAAASFKSGYSTTAFTGDARRAGIISGSDLGRDLASVQVSIDVPIASTRTGFLDALGNLSLNGNYAIDKLSDFGRLETIGYGVNWRPIDAIRINASVTHEDGAPGVAQLGNPVVVTPDVRVFDFATGQNVNITTVEGGNRALVADNRRVTKLGVTLKPWDKPDLTLTANYLRTRTRDPISSFPAATAAIEAAFPDRFTRDATGRLLRIDNRPVNFDRRDEEQLRWGINFSGRIGAEPQRPAGFGFRRGMRDGAAPANGARPADTTPPAPGTPAPDATAPAQTPPGGDATPAPGNRRFAGGPGGGGGRRFGGGGMALGTRVQFAVYHTLRFEDRITVRPGLPVLDLLDGFALGSRGGQPRNAVEIQAGITKDGFGARLSGEWQQGTLLRGGTSANATSDLAFSDLTSLTLRLFANFQPNMKVVRENRWLRGTRLTLTVQNLLDTKLRVTDPTGRVPLNYQPDLLDPTGRTIRIGIRKLFF